MVFWALITGCVDATVSSTDDPPQVTWISPVDGAAFQPGEALTMCAQVSDEDNLEWLELTLTSSIDDVIWTHDSGFTSCPGGNVGLLLALSDSDQDLVLTAVDTRGRAGQATLRLVADTNSAPWCELHTPRDGHATELGDTVAVEANVGDAEVDQTDLSVRLATDLDGEFWTGTPDSDGSIATLWTPTIDGTHSFSLVVEDPRGKAQTCEAAIVVDACTDEDLDSWTSCGGDCDDDDALSYPDAPEEPDSADNDCDETVDEGTTLYDDDGDGTSEVDGDCDDTDATVYEGAPEIAHDGVDQDCDGGDLIDGDQDGYTGEESGGVDCDDTDPAVFPGAGEIWYDGVDQDCGDDSDLDADGDGFDSSDHGGDDCDDTDIWVNPDAVETWYDGIDTDCDGWSDDDADADGHDASTQGGDDCDDADPSVSPSATEVRDGLDNDCNGACDEGLVSVGDVIITEVLFDPDAVEDSAGEWFEVHNTTSVDVAICADWTFQDDDSDSFVLPSGTQVFLPAGGYAVFARETDTSSNGGVPADHGFATGMQLANGDDELVLLHGGTELDRIAWDDGVTFPDPTGASMSLDPGAYDHSDNDSGDNWCTATSTYGDGDRGTPGAANDGC